MTEWERQKEWKEFTRAARVYQPLATSLASKFTRGQAEEGGGDKMEKLKVFTTHAYMYIHLLSINTLLIVSFHNKMKRGLLVRCGCEYDIQRYQRTYNQWEISIQKTTFRPSFVGLHQAFLQEQRSELLIYTKKMTSLSTEKQN